MRRAAGHEDGRGCPFVFPLSLIFFFCFSLVFFFFWVCSFVVFFFLLFVCFPSLFLPLGASPRNAAYNDDQCAPPPFEHMTIASSSALMNIATARSHGSRKPPRTASFPFGDDEIIPARIQGGGKGKGGKLRGGGRTKEANFRGMGEGHNKNNSNILGGGGGGRRKIRPAK